MVDGEKPPAVGDRPNVLWICTDQQRFDTIAALGNGAVRTPNLDRLVSVGVAFTNAYAQCPICTPSRASFLTGCYPSTIHVHRNGNAAFPATPPLVTRLLADAGYDCGLVGKLHLSAAAERVEIRPDDGYRVFQWSHHPQPEAFWPVEQHAYQGWLRRQGVDWSLAYGADTPPGWERTEHYRSGIAARYHQTTWCAEETIAFLEAPRDKPWLMSVNIFDPHPPFDPPPEFLERMDVARMPLPLYRDDEQERQRAFAAIDFQTTPLPPTEYDARRMVAAYYAQIELIDEQVGRMLAALAASGQRDNTIVIFTSDHGEMLGDHGLRFKGYRFYEGLVHIPLIIAWPGHYLADRRSEALVELVDIAPTLLEAAGLPVPAWMQGRSLAPILTGDADPARHRAFVLSEYHDAIAMADASEATMLFDGRFKLVVYHGHAIGELYDVATDPHEFDSLWDTPGSTQQQQRLLKTAFDAVVLSGDKGAPRVARF